MQKHSHEILFKNIANEIQVHNNQFKQQTTNTKKLNFCTKYSVNLNVKDLTFFENIKQS